MRAASIFLLGSLWNCFCNGGLASRLSRRGLARAPPWRKQSYSRFQTMFEHAAVVAVGGGWDWWGQTQGHHVLFQKHSRWSRCTQICTFASLFTSTNMQWPCHMQYWLADQMEQGNATYTRILWIPTGQLFIEHPRSVGLRWQGTLCIWFWCKTERPLARSLFVFWNVHENMCCPSLCRRKKTIPNFVLTIVL